MGPFKPKLILHCLIHSLYSHPFHRLYSFGYYSTASFILCLFTFLSSKNKFVFADASTSAETILKTPLRFHIKKQKSQKVTIIEDFDISGLKLIKVPKRRQSSSQNMERQADTKFRKLPARVAMELWLLLLISK
ncbi:uncharacterized protein LOC107876505 [Capsicum annuum]|uniref:uncharacterized protein LOC107876505 n=1 Tax=Capsicum annuum TaxID=4072 RepID=UPI001FB17E8B|nr:uncharacterized protein LOC107876505 [Capsicum annuum]